MATSSFLTSAQRKEGLEYFKSLPRKQSSLLFSKWLEEALLSRLEKLPAWQEALPVALGSWARGELCPKSDIDLLFCGSEEKVSQFMEAAQAEGLKVRARIPEDPKDWTQGVGPFDVIALLRAKAFSTEAQVLLKEQQENILWRGSEWKKSLTQEMRKERRERSKRYDSITHFLEPNIKYGPGGLRDLQQALVVVSLFPQKFNGQDKVFRLVNENRNFLLSVRQGLHLIGGSEVLSAAEQLELSPLFAFSDVRLFARKIQLALDRISFFSDWCMEQVRLSGPKRKQYQKSPEDQISVLVEEMLADPSLSQQWKLRSQMVDIWKREKPDSKQRGRWLQKYLQLNVKEEFLTALFRSRVLEKWVPDLARVKGLVQHDHYHRFTLETHILQCLRWLRRAYKKPKSLGRLQFLVKEFDADDWRVLTLAALYHDLGKGLGGDHSSKGVQLVKRDFKNFGFPEKWTQDVCWLVENHLILSTAAFRRNPQDPSTWSWLHDRGVKGVALRRLALWTWVDIQATNPDAWTNWKAQLLEDLVKALESEGADRFRKFLDMSRAQELSPTAGFDRKILEEIDLATLQTLPLKILIKDIKNIVEGEGDEPLLVKRLSPHRTWIRFHRRQDRKGLFLEFVQSLYASGCTILQSSVRTLPQLGVYDWFLVKTSRSPQQLKKTIDLIQPKLSKEYSKIRFEQIQLIQSSDKEFVFSLRGRDKRGMLLAAAQALYDEDLEVLWAKVHTWGRQVDDIFSVKSQSKAEEILLRLRDKWMENPRSEFEL